MRDFIFRPWVGERFGLSTDILSKPLFLSESHYWADEPIEYFTIRCIETLAKSERPVRYFTKAIRGFFGREVNRQSAWDYVAFSNYIQHSMSGPRISPSEEQWAIGAESFGSVLDFVKPDCVIIYGYGVGARVRAAFGSGGADWLFTIGYGGQNIPAVILKHPSSSFRYAEASGRLSRLRDYVRVNAKS